MRCETSCCVETRHIWLLQVGTLDARTVFRLQEEYNFGRDVPISPSSDAFHAKRLPTHSRVKFSPRLLAVPRSGTPPKTGGRADSQGVQEGQQLPEAHRPA